MNNIQFLELHRATFFLEQKVVILNLVMDLQQQQILNHTKPQWETFLQKITNNQNEHIFGPKAFK